MKTACCFTRLIWLTALLLVGGCATAPPLQTPSQRPEVTISGATKKEILDVLVAEMLANGAQIKQMNDYSVVFGKRDSSLSGALLFGSKYDSTPEMRITYNMVETGKAIRVFCNAAMVTNPGSGFERVNDVTGGKLAHEIQAMLERLKAKTQK
jgi:hypothetical protein